MGFAIANISILYSYLIIYCIFKLFEPLILLTNTFDNLHYKYMAPSLVMKYFLFSLTLSTCLSLYKSAANSLAI